MTSSCTPMTIDAVNEVINKRIEGRYDQVKTTCERMVSEGRYEYTMPLCRIHIYGLGVEKNPSIAESILEDVIEKTDADWCKRELANLLLSRCITDCSRCADLLSELSTKDDGRIIGMQARAYYHGIGTDRNIPEAVACYRKAYEMGIVWAGFELVDILKSDKNTEKDAFELCKSIAESGNAKAMGFLGRMYRDGTGVRANKKQAEIWLRKASNAGLKWAMKDYLSLSSNNR